MPTKEAIRLVEEGVNIDPKLWEIVARTLYMEVLSLRDENKYIQCEDEKYRLKITGKITEKRIVPD